MAFLSPRKFRDDAFDEDGFAEGWIHTNPGDAPEALNRDYTRTEPPVEDMIDFLSKRKIERSIIDGMNIQQIKELYRKHTQTQSAAGQAPQARSASLNPQPAQKVSGWAKSSENLRGRQIGSYTDFSSAKTDAQPSSSLFEQHMSQGRDKKKLFNLDIFGRYTTNSSEEQTSKQVTTDNPKTL